MRDGMKVDLVSLASGAVIAALGALVLLDSSGALDLSLGWIAVALTGGGRRDPAAQRARRRRREPSRLSEMSAAAGLPPLRRDTRRGLVGGVLAGLGARTGIDPVILRVAFVIAAVASGGLALLAYVVAWAALPADGRRIGAAARGSAALPRVRGDWRVAAGVGLLTLSALLAFRELGIWWSDALVWPLVLAAFGAALLWGRSRAARARDAHRVGGPRASAAAGGEPAPTPRPTPAPSRGSPTSTAASSACCS